MILKLGMKHQYEELYKVSAFEWGKLSKCHLKGITLWERANGLKIYDSEKTLDPRGRFAPIPGQYTCILP